jgi:hypothetical protein
MLREELALGLAREIARRDLDLLAMEGAALVDRRVPGERRLYGVLVFALHAIDVSIGNVHVNDVRLGAKHLDVPERWPEMARDRHLAWLDLGLMPHFPVVVCGNRDFDLHATQDVTRRELPCLL